MTLRVDIKSNYLSEFECWYKVHHITLTNSWTESISVVVGIILYEDQMIWSGSVDDISWTINIF
jgi:hypothetical protein